ncbi:MAG: 5-(carboxyamino)imidazole ribonucleotide mutase [candidate division KSB1 bacterium]|nr:5-(carboxyamino)imidazole ribonucleotide mutase [candidate division KSB1 bacterium]MDZ7303372.1 5-(carboxyamino)imidazole ribonucleotide mutase [candidate division KSB1 bacterium]MDZ7312310.1 5-(carboxyamino)imidazole ribonucleotide mutase [candidate division KSB1 bacterium]
MIAEKVAILMGSASDQPVLENCKKHLEAFGITCEERILSAHRTPEAVSEFARQAESAGYGVIIAGAGMAAHLPGVVAAHTVLPVIGVPIASGALNGFDALLSIVQMPSGVPVATVAIGGAVNAAILAAEILATKYPELRERLREFKAKGAKL